MGEFSSLLITNQGFHNHLVGGSRLEGVVEFTVGGVGVRTVCGGTRPG